MKNFERNIKTKANAFQMDPSPDSFDKVMKALEKKKKRRFIFWLWFIIPGLAIGATFGTYHIFTGSDNTVLAHKKNQETGISKQHSYQNTTSQADTNQQLIANPTDHSSSTVTYMDNTTSDNNSTQNKKTEIKNENKQVKGNNQSTTKTEVKNTNSFTRTHYPVVVDHVPQNNHTQNVNISETKRMEKESIINISSFSSVVIPSAFSRSSFARKDVPLVPAILPSPKDQTSRFSLGIYTDLGTSKSNFYTDVPKDSTTVGYYTTTRSTTDKFTFSYSAGLQFRYSPVKFLSIETGIGFTRFQSYQIVAYGGVSSSMVNSPADLDTVFSFESFTPATKEFYNIYDYISIPVKVYYQKRWNWIGLEAGGGVIFDIPVNTYSYRADENNGSSYLTSNVNDSRLNKFGILASANLNLVFHVKKFSFHVGPTFKYRINSMYDENYIMRQHPYFIGGQIGARYNF